MLTLCEKPKECKANKPRCLIRKCFKNTKALNRKFMLRSVNILRMEVRSPNCHCVFVRLLDYSVYASWSELLQTQRTGVYLIDKVVHQQVVLYDSDCELLIIHHVLKQTTSLTSQHNTEWNEWMNVWWWHSTQWLILKNKSKMYDKVSDSNLLHCKFAFAYTYVSSSASFALPVALLTNLYPWLFVLSPLPRQTGESRLWHFARRSAGGCTV